MKCELLIGIFASFAHKIGTPHSKFDYTCVRARTLFLTLLTLVCLLVFNSIQLFATTGFDGKKQTLRESRCRITDLLG